MKKLSLFIVYVICVIALIYWVDNNQNNTNHRIDMVVWENGYLTGLNNGMILCTKAIKTGEVSTKEERYIIYKRDSLTFDEFLNK